MKTHEELLDMLRKARIYVAAGVNAAQENRNAEAWERATSLLRDIDAATNQPYSVVMRLLKNEWVGVASANVGSAGDRELSDAMAQWRNISVTVKGKPMLMRIVERTVEGETAMFELAEPLA